MTAAKSSTKSMLGGAAAIVGVGQTDYRLDQERVRKGEKPHDSYGYAAVAFRRALDDAGLKASDIDGVVSGNTAHERLCEMLGVNTRWGARSDPMTGIQESCLAIATGRAECIALVYGNDQRSASVAYGGADAMGGNVFLSYVYHAPWGFTSQGALYAILFRRYMEETGFTEADLGQVAVAQRLHARRNPGALMHKPLAIEDYLKSAYIVEPLHLFDYCLINDGGVAFIIMSAERAKKRAHKTPAVIHGIGRYDLNVGATSLEPRLTDFYRPAQRAAGEQSFNMAGVGPKDMDCMQVYDSFSPHIPLALEGYGYCEVGGASKFFRDRGISLERGFPVNTGGGHLSETYMQGWQHQIEAVRQIRGECQERQVPNCRYVHYTADVAGKAMSIIYGR